MIIMWSAVYIHNITEQGVCGQTPHGKFDFLGYIRWYLKAFLTIHG